MNAFLSVVYLFIAQSARPFGLPDEPSTKRPSDLVLLNAYLLILIFLCDNGEVMWSHSLLALTFAA